MSIQLNHTVVLAHDNQAGAEFLAHILGLEVGPPAGPFVPVTTANGVTLDFYSVPGHTETLAHVRSRADSAPPEPLPLGLVR